MRHQQVVPDYIVMLESSVTVLALVGCGWLLFKLVSACIWFPQYMKKLEVESLKANEHFEEKLLPKGEGKSEEPKVAEIEKEESSKEAVEDSKKEEPNDKKLESDDKATDSESESSSDDQDDEPENPEDEVDEPKKDK